MVLEVVDWMIVSEWKCSSLTSSWVLLCRYLAFEESGEIKVNNGLNIALIPRLTTKRDTLLTMRLTKALAEMI